MALTLGRKRMWLETDEREEVFVTLSALSDFIQRANNEIYYWKWVFIALHNLVQGSMVVALRRTDGFGPIAESAEKKWHDHYAKTGESIDVKEKLMRFLELYEKIKKDDMIQWSSKKCYTPSGNQDWSMKKLNEIRNEFIHFTPKGWSLDLSGGPALCLSVLEIPEFLLANCGGFTIPQDIQDESYLEHLRTIRFHLESLKVKYSQPNV